MQIEEKFIISNQKIIHEKKEIYGVFDSESQRIYINEIPSLGVESFISQLTKISELDDVKAIQIEFDRYNEQYNVEIELYLEAEQLREELPNIIFSVQDTPCGCTVSERFYDEMIEFLKKASN